MNVLWAQCEFIPVTPIVYGFDRVVGTEKERNVCGVRAEIEYVMSFSALQNSKNKIKDLLHMSLFQCDT